MFYCNPCGLQKGWPTDALMTSRGECEICRKTAVCNDVASKDLPRPAQEEGSPLSEREKDGIAKIAYFFRYTMGRMNVAQSALSGEDIANWNGAAIATDQLCRDHGIGICDDQY